MSDRDVPVPSDDDPELEPLDEAEADRLLAALGAADPPPDEIVQSARGLFAWRTIDAELAELSYDSELDEQALAGVRGAGELRQLTFEAEGVRLDVEVTTGPPARLVGQLAPSGAARVEVRSPQGSVTVDADDHGRFTVSELQPGPVSLRCTPTGRDATVVETGWVHL
jgi:hypothetical protein